MIHNLNQLTFSKFGIVSPERPPIPKDDDDESMIEQKNTLSASQGSVPVYQTNADTWIYCGAGMTVLSVSVDGEDFQHFYLDKPVCIRSGIYFCISPFRQTDTTVYFTAAQWPDELEKTLDPGQLHVSNRLRVTGLYTFFYHEKEQGFFFPGESHPMLELTYVDRGSMHSVADGQDLLLKQGDMVVYGANQWHMQYADIGVAPRYVTISFDLTGSDLSGLLNRKFTPPQAAVELLQQMLRQQERMDAYTDDIIISQLTLLLLTVLQHDGTPSVKLKTANSFRNENETIRRAQQYISAHIREKLSVPIVAQKAGVSPSYLTALFHKNLQISPGEYIRRIKLQESKQMIRENAMNFSEIATVLEYSSVHYFSRQFKDKFGITPTEYAKSVRFR